MKKLYAIFTALLFVGVVNAQTLLIDENFNDWDPTGVTGFTVNVYGNWTYTSPGNNTFEVRNCRVPNVTATSRVVDLERDNRTVEQGGPGAFIFPEIPSCSKIEIDVRSGNNASVEGDRDIYISVYSTGSFTKISPYYPAIGINNLDGAPFSTYTNTTDVASTDPITYAIQGRGNGNLRLEGVRVWSVGGSSSINNKKVSDIIIYTTPKNIKIGGDVAFVEIINLAGSVIKTSNIKGIQSISTSDLKSGIYIVKATDSNGLVKIEKVIIQ